MERARKRAEKANDKPSVQAFTKLHDLRHTFGSWHLGENNENVLYVSKQMGHSKPSITLNIYAHLLTQRRPQAAAKLGELLFGKAVASD